MNTTTRGAAALLLATVMALGTTGLAQARGDGEIRRQGSCDGSADWKIKAKPDDGRIEVEAEIDSNTNGQQWRWVLRHNGSAAARGTSTTKAPSGSFSVERRTVDADGADRFRFRAVDNDSGQVCIARLRY
jgi:hypothetical protein